MEGRIEMDDDVEFQVEFGNLGQRITQYREDGDLWVEDYGADAVVSLTKESARELRDALSTWLGEGGSTTDGD